MREGSDLGEEETCGVVGQSVRLHSLLSLTHTET